MTEGRRRVESLEFSLGTELKPSNAWEEPLLTLRDEFYEDDGDSDEHLMMVIVLMAVRDCDGMGRMEVEVSMVTDTNANNGDDSNGEVSSCLLMKTMSLELTKA